MVDDVIGFDVGWSTARPSTGVCRTVPRVLTTTTAQSSLWMGALLLDSSAPTRVAAIDGPLLPQLALHHAPRAVERFFSLGRFQRRCKPGLSHVKGTGAQLRSISRRVAQQFEPFVSRAELAAPFPRVSEANLIETFPNACLAVLIEESPFPVKPVRRGTKSDVYFKVAQEVGQLDRFANAVGAAGAFGAFESITDHDLRAAVVCALVAVSVAHGKFVAIGEVRGGWFFLPPWDLWADWARSAMHENCRRADVSVDVWLDGRVGLP